MTQTASAWRGGSKMKHFSRWMPQFVVAPTTTRQKIAPAAIAVLGAGGLIWFSAVRVIGLGLVVVVAVILLYEELRLRRVSAERQGEDIGTFAKAFDRRSPEFDPWVVRAVWDALQPYRSHRGGVAPLRPSDRLTLLMGVDDIYDVVAPEIAQRAGRSLDNPEANPKYRQVETVADVVQFFWHQPRVRQPDRPV